MKHYNYNVKKDYIYNFSEDYKFEHKVELNNGKLKLPDNLQECETAFLPVYLKSIFVIGSLLQPYIKLSSGDIKVNEYFEYGTQGIRYLNLSDFTENHITDINIRSNFSEIASISNLICFKKIEIVNQKILVISPHPDDAEIASFGLYSDKRIESFILTITAGNGGINKYDELFADSKIGLKQKGLFRVWDSLFVPVLAGIPLGHTFNLGYDDQLLEPLSEEDPSVIAGKSSNTIAIFRKMNTTNLVNLPLVQHQSWAALVNDIALILKTIKPNLIVTPFPEFDAHSDHKYSTFALIDAIKQINYSEGNLLLYTNHYPGSEYYPFGNQYDPITLPPNFDNNLIFSSVFSYPLDTKTRKKKVLILENMHDLRLDTEWLTISGASEILIENTKNFILNNNKSYFRRAIRANELFFVLPIEKLYTTTYIKKQSGKH